MLILTRQYQWLSCLIWLVYILSTSSIKATKIHDRNFEQNWTRTSNLTVKLSLEHKNDDDDDDKWPKLMSSFNQNSPTLEPQLQLQLQIDNNNPDNKIQLKILNSLIQLNNQSVDNENLLIFTQPYNTDDDVHSKLDQQIQQPEPVPSSSETSFNMNQNTKPRIEYDIIVPLFSSESTISNYSDDEQIIMNNFQRNKREEIEELLLDSTSSGASGAGATTTGNGPIQQINDSILNNTNTDVISTIDSLLLIDLDNSKLQTNNTYSMEILYPETNDYPLVISTSVSSTSCTIETNGNCSNYTMSCDDDTVPCNATYEEYMQYLYDYVYPSVSEWILIGSHCVVFLTGLIGNALVCIAVYTNYSMRTVTNVFIVNLAVADFFVIFICLPPTVVWDVAETWFLGESMCKIVLYFQSVSVTVSVLTLTFISVDRWYAICFPLRYRTKITRAIASVALIWTVALLSDIPEFLALTLKKIPVRYETVLFTQCQTNWRFDTEKNFYIFRLVMLYVLPLILMSIAYFKIVRVLWRSETIPGHRESRNHHQYTCKYARGSQMPTSANTSTMGQLRARRKAAKMLVAVVIMFAVCYFPVHAFNIMRYTDRLPAGELTSIFSLMSHWLCYANSAINPIIYNFMSGKFRREFRNALEKCRCATVRVEDRSLNHSNPASRLNNVSPSSRSNYQLTSVRDITRDLSRQQTIQTTFVDNNNCVNNGHSTVVLPKLNNNNNPKLEQHQHQHQQHPQQQQQQQIP